MKIPPIWTDALRSLHEAGFREAFIGGGALRDLELGRDVKDVDIFVMEHVDGETITRLNEAFGIPGDLMEIEGERYEVCSPELMGVVSYTPLDPAEPPFQVIVLPEGERATFIVDQLARFDIGLCKIAYDGVDVIRTADYLADRDGKTMTVVSAPTGGHLTASWRRLDRLSKKYPDFRQVLPAIEEPVF